MNVQNMNDKPQGGGDRYRSLLLLDEIASGRAHSQRDLSRRLNIALGLVNAYLKNLISKGYVKIKAIPPRRYGYYLTPKGFTEKTRLTYRLLQDYTRFYQRARRDYSELFRELGKKGTEGVVFAGLDEISEIAYLSLSEAGMDLKGVVDEVRAGEDFFGKSVVPYGALKELAGQTFVIAVFDTKDLVRKNLLDAGIPAEEIYSVA